MTKVEHRIEQITKRLATVKESVERVAAEYSFEIEDLEAKLKEAKGRIKADRLSESESKYYKILSIGLKTETPLSVLVRLFLTEETQTGHRVLGSDRVTWYEVEGAESGPLYCPCPRFAAKHNCPHIEAVRLLTRLKYGSSVAATFGIEKS